MTSKQVPESLPAVLGVAREISSVVLVVGLLSVLLYGFVRDQSRMQHAETALIVDVKSTTNTHTDICGPPTRDGRPTIVSMLYSDDKQAWLEDVAETFAKVCPNIQVKLQAMTDIDSADAIFAGDARPMLWSPADDLVLSYLDARWKKHKPNEKPLFDETKQTEIAASPMVVLMWKNRAQVIGRIIAQRPMENGPWVDVACANVPNQPILDGMVISDMVPGTWIDWYNPVMPPVPTEAQVRLARLQKPKKAVEPPVEDITGVYQAPFPTLAQIKSWGRVKIGHTSPTRSAAGLEALYLMAYDYVMPPKKRPEAAKNARKAAQADPAYRGRVFSTDIDKPDFQRAFSEDKKAFGTWLRRCEAGLDPAPKSAGQLTDHFFSVGESRYDAVVTYEHLTFELFGRIDAYANTMSTMEVLYPFPTIMNQHPVVTIISDQWTEVQHFAARKWLDYLRSVEVQKRAIEFGFRPVNPAVSIRDDNSEANPFLRYRRYGVDFETVVIEPPRLEGADIYDMVRIWEDATGRN